VSENQPEPWAGATDKFVHRFQTNMRQGLKAGCGCFVVVFVLAVVLATCTVMTDKPPAAVKPAATPAAAKQPSAGLEQAVLGQWRAVLAETTRCDEATKKAQAAMALVKERGLQNIASPAALAEQTCANAEDAIENMSAPAAVPTDKRPAFEQALQNCAGIGANRSYAFHLTGKALQGDLRPQTMADAKDQLDLADVSAVKCVAGYFDAAAAVGIPAERMKP
jgi:hypothetical protein